MTTLTYLLTLAALSTAFAISVLQFSRARLWSGLAAALAAVPIALTINGPHPALAIAAVAVLYLAGGAVVAVVQTRRSRQAA